MKMKLRSQEWFANAEADMASIYFERFLNDGTTMEEILSGKPIIGIAQSGSDLSPCNKHHLVLAERVKDGIRDAGGIPIEFPVHPIQENGKRPTAGLDRNLAYLGLVEVLHGYPIDGVVLMTGCDKTTPALLMGAATLDIPSIALTVGPMLNGYHRGKPVGCGTIVWDARKDLASNKIDRQEYFDLTASQATSAGYCNTMGTATTMNSLTEVLGMSLPGCAAIPAVYRERGEMSYWTGKQAVELVKKDITPSQILTKNAFINAIKLTSALGGSTNAPIHLKAIASHIGVDISNDTWQKYGYDIPLLVNLQPSGEFLGEDFYRAGGVPAVASELIKHNLLDESTLTVSGKTLGENYKFSKNYDCRVVKTVDEPLKVQSGFASLKGNIFDTAIIKTCVISEDFKNDYLSNPEDMNAFEAKVVVFEGRDDYKERIDDPKLNITKNSILVIRGAGVIGHPGAAEVVNMRPPSYLIEQGIEELPCLGDGRQSGTAGCPAILNVSPEAAINGRIAILKDGDIIRVDLNSYEVNVLLSEEEIKQRIDSLNNSGGYKYPESQTPWQEIQRGMITQLDEGMTLKPALKYQKVKDKLPRHNH